MDQQLRLAEKRYREHPNAETLRAYNTALARAGEETYLPIAFLQQLFNDLVGLIDYPQTSTDEFAHWYVHRAAGALDSVDYNFNAFNIFGNKHTNACLDITATFPNHIVIINIVPDDLIYVNMRLSGRGQRWATEQLQHQPWVYRAEDIIHFIATLQPGDVRRNPDPDIRQLEREYASTGSLAVFRQLHRARLRAGLTELDHPALAWLEEQIHNIPANTALQELPTWEMLVSRAETLFNEPEDLIQDNGRRYPIRGHIYYHPIRDTLFAMREALIDPDDVQSELDDAVQELANESAAEGWSHIGDLPYLDYGEDLQPEDLWQYAEFGYAYAVDGDLILDGTGERLLHREQVSLDPPEGFVRLNVGGDLGNQEQEVSSEFAIDRIADRLGVRPEFVRTLLVQTLQEEGVDLPDYIYMTSDAGEAQMYGNPDKIYEQYRA